MAKGTQTAVGFRVHHIRARRTCYIIYHKLVLSHHWYAPIRSTFTCPLSFYRFIYFRLIFSHQVWFWFTYSVFPVCTSAYMHLSLFLSSSHLRSSVCLLRHTCACLFSRRFRRRRDVFPDVAVKEPVPRLHIDDVYTRSSGRVTDVTKLNRRG